MRSTQSFAKSSKSEKEEKGGKLNNNRSLGLMTVEQIQDLIANAVKVQLEGDARKTHLYTKP